MPEARVFARCRARRITRIGIATLRHADLIFRRQYHVRFRLMPLRYHDAITRYVAFYFLLRCWLRH